jgi:hypothetical protein
VTKPCFCSFIYDRLLLRPLFHVINFFFRPRVAYYRSGKRKFQSELYEQTEHITVEKAGA